jgi:glycosyltransferase involved in cell wall biosynthesis
LASFLEGGTPNETLEQAEIAGLRNFGIPMSSRFDIRALWKLIQLLRLEKIGLLCSHGYKSTVMGWWAGRRVGIPVVAYSHGWTHENRKVRFYESLDRLFLRFVHHIVAVSESQKRELLNLGIKPERITVVHNAIELTNSCRYPERNLRSILGINNTTPVGVSAGRLSPEKNFAGLIEAAVIVKRAIPSVVFVVFGEGVLKEELTRRIIALGLETSFLLPGFRNDFINLLYDADLFVLPSFTEGLPVVILEAYASKRPVVATAVGGNPEVIRDGETGFLVPAGNVSALAEKIVFLIKNQDLSSRMGEAGYLRVKSDFTSESQTQKLEAIYNEVLKEF